MRIEFGSVLASTAGQTYHFNVNNLDPYQLALFRKFLATYCFAYKISDKNFPPLLFTEVVLCLNLDNEILPSIEAYGGEAHAQARSGYDATTCDSPGIKFMLKDHSSVFTGSTEETSKSESMTEERAKLARHALRYIHNRYDLCQPDQRAMMLALGRLTEMVENHNHYWPTTSNETRDDWREPEVDIGRKIFW